LKSLAYFTNDCSSKPKNRSRSPYFDEYRNDDYAGELFAMSERTLHVTQCEPGR
jgi:hypothetical protein